jgi:hypothetical protein
MEQGYLRTDEGLDNLYEVYTKFITRFSCHLSQCIEFEYFVEFAKKYDFYSSLYEHKFKYRQFPNYEIDHATIEFMYEFLMHHSKEYTFFEELTSSNFMLFIAPFMEELRDQDEEYINDEDPYDAPIILNYRTIIPDTTDNYDNNL